MSQRLLARCVALVFPVVSIGCQQPEYHGSDFDRTQVSVQLDVVYGNVDGTALVTDVAFPTVVTEPRPVVILVHGGRWEFGHNRDYSVLSVADLARAGFVTLSIEYRLKAAPGCYQDLQTAIRWVHAHASEYNIDESRIFVMGQSAGGHMAALAATLGDSGYPRTGGWETASADIAGAISVAGAYDLASLEWGSAWASDPAELALGSPNLHVSRATRPLLVLHSDNDASVPMANALKMISASQAAGAPVEFKRYGDAGHMSMTDEMVKQALLFIEKVSRRPVGGVDYYTKPAADDVVRCVADCTPLGGRRLEVACWSHQRAVCSCNVPGSPLGMAEEAVCVDVAGYERFKDGTTGAGTSIAYMYNTTEWDYGGSCPVHKMAVCETDAAGMRMSCRCDRD